MCIDLSGSVTFLSCIALSLCSAGLRKTLLATNNGIAESFPDISSFHPRQLIMSGLTALWTIRLGNPFQYKTN
jgi:hypothetical protein